jgi:hypothetical protein
VAEGLRSGVAVVRVGIGVGELLEFVLVLVVIC